LARVAFLSGGKDSFYAALQRWPIDFGVLLVYDFPRPSPHLVNLGKSVETLLLTNISVVVAKLSRGRERVETVELLKRLRATEIVAGDVYIDEHLKYMESIASEVGATLYEPLWGMDPEELLYREVRDGIEFLVVGARKELREWVGRVVNEENVAGFSSHAKSHSIDPLGERGEYHTLIISSPVHRRKLDYRVYGCDEYPDYVVLRVG